MQLLCFKKRFQERSNKIISKSNAVIAAQDEIRHSYLGFNALILVSHGSRHGHETDLLVQPLEREKHI